MISFKSALTGIGILITGILSGIVIAPRPRHYSLHSPQNLARLARGREIRRAQQRAMSANKRAEKRARLLEKLKKL